jgi:hypothetical protein
MPLATSPNPSQPSSIKNYPENLNLLYFHLASYEQVATQATGKIKTTL